MMHAHKNLLFLYIDKALWKPWLGIIQAKAHDIAVVAISVLRAI